MYLRTLIIFASSFIPGLAYGALPPVGTKLDNPIDAENVQQFIADILDVVVAIGIPVAILFVIYAGFLFVTAQGSEDKLKTAKSAFLWAVIGATILIGANVIVDAIIGTVNQI